MTIKTFEEHFSMNEGTEAIPAFLSDIELLRNKYTKSLLGYRESLLLHHKDSTVRQDLDASEDGTIFVVENPNGKSFRFKWRHGLYKTNFTVVG